MSEEIIAALVIGSFTLSMLVFLGIVGYFCWIVKTSFQTIEENRAILRECSELLEERGRIIGWGEKKKNG